MIAAAPNDVFRKGQLVNNTYRIEGVLGRGGTGQVYKAFNEVAQKTCAIKVLATESASIPVCSGW